MINDSWHLGNLWQQEIPQECRHSNFSFLLVISCDSLRPLSHSSPNLNTYLQGLAKWFTFSVFENVCVVMFIVANVMYCHNKLQHIMQVLFDLFLSINGTESSPECEGVINEWTILNNRPLISFNHPTTIQSPLQSAYCIKQWMLHPEELSDTYGSHADIGVTNIAVHGK
jgi:hypothetical protein